MSTNDAGPLAIVILKARKNPARRDSLKLRPHRTEDLFADIGNHHIKTVRPNRIDAADKERNRFCSIRINVAGHDSPGAQQLGGNR